MRFTILAAVLGGSLGLIEPALAEVPAAPAGEAVLGEITVSGAIARPSLGAAPMSAVYLTIATIGAPDRLIAAATPAARAAELHESRMVDGAMQMAPIPGGVPVAPGAEAVFAPGAMHVMLIGLVEPLREGDEIALTLTFEKAGDVTLTVPVGDPASRNGD